MSAVLEHTAQTPQAIATGQIVSSKPSLIAKFAARFHVEPGKVLATLKATAFRQRADRDGFVREVTNEEMMALLIIADQYNLNPFTREIYAFFDKKSGAIVPVVSVDGWSRIINERPELDGISFVYSDKVGEHKGKKVHEWIECTIRRKDRSEPIVIREFFDEVVRNESYATPWDTHPKRMHRHKTLIQCSRVAFGFAGIFDEDEAQRIAEAQAAQVASPNDAIDVLNAGIQSQPAALPNAPSPTLQPQPARAPETVAVAQSAEHVPPPPPHSAAGEVAGSSPAGDDATIIDPADDPAVGRADPQAVETLVADWIAAIDSAEDREALDAIAARADAALRGKATDAQQAKVAAAVEKAGKRLTKAASPASKPTKP